MTLRIILLPLLLGYNLGMPIVANDPVVIPPLPIANDRVYVQIRTDKTAHNASREPDSNTAITGTYRTVTAYTSYPEFTDSTPCIGAWGDDLCELFRTTGDGICATNFYPRGTRLDIANYGTCTVLDRMASRYPERVDIYMGYDTPAALQWGIRTVNVKEI